METTVQVLLSAYNGADFLMEQLRSLYAQRGVNVQILVRDDGSTDATRQLLEAEQAAGRLTFYTGENLGWARSFMDLVYHSGSADYFAFCDHDDIWLPEKLQKAVESLEKRGKRKEEREVFGNSSSKDYNPQAEELPTNSSQTDKPQTSNLKPQTTDLPRLYSSNLYYFRNGETTGKVYPDGREWSLERGLVQCVSAGCTMVFNRKLRDLLKTHPPRELRAHDWWTYLVALSMGEAYYDDDAYLLYRQHDHNQIGDKRTFTEIWRRRLKKIPTAFGQHEREQMAQELLRLFGDEMEIDRRASVEEVAFYRKSLRNRLRLFADRRFTMGRLSNDSWLRLRILLGIV